MPYLGIFELKFENLVIFETSFLEFIKLENFGKKTKMPKFWIKNTLFWTFGAKICTNYCHISN